MKGFDGSDCRGKNLTVKERVASGMLTAKERDLMDLTVNEGYLMDLTVKEGI